MLLSTAGPQPHANVRRTQETAESKVHVLLRRKGRGIAVTLLEVPATVPSVIRVRT